MGGHASSRTSPKPIGSIFIEVPKPTPGRKTNVPEREPRREGRVFPFLDHVLAPIVHFTRFENVRMEEIATVDRGDPS